MNKIKLIKRLIILAWISLLICWVIKIFGGNYFQIMVDNQRFISLCNFIEENAVLNYSIYLSIFLLNRIIIGLTIIRQKSFTKKQWFVIIPVLIICWIPKLFITDMYLAFAYDLLVICILIPMITTRAKLSRCILLFILDFAFQFISVEVKNLSLHQFVTNNFIISIIYSIDKFIMIILSYLYANLLRKEGIGMGVFWEGLISEEETQMEAYSKFKKFWIKFWRLITLQFIWNKKLNKNKKEYQMVNLEEDTDEK